MLSKLKEWSHNEFLSFEVEVVGQPSPESPILKLRVLTKMAKDGRLHTQLIIDGKITNDLLIRNGRVREQRFDFENIPDLVLTYTIPPASGRSTGRIFLLVGVEQYACPAGSCLESWLGDESRHTSQFFPTAILDGEFIPDEEFEGWKCKVIAWNRPEVARRDIMYFESETGFVRRWDIFYTDLGPTPVWSRSAYYRNISTAAIPDQEWEVKDDPCSSNPYRMTLMVPSVESRKEVQMKEGP